MTKKLTAVLLFGLLVLSACQTGGGASTPSGAVQGSADAIKADDYAKFVGYLSTESIDLLDQMSGAFIEMAKVDEEAKAELEKEFGISIEEFEKLDKKDKLAKIFKGENYEGHGDFEIVSEEIDGDNAIVTINVEGEEQEIPLVKEADGWKIVFGIM